MTVRKWMFAVFAVLLLAGCSKKQEVGPGTLTGEKAKAGAKLAYEHSVNVELPEAQIAGRMAAMRDACELQRFGACNVLRMQQGEWRSSLVVRAVPGAIEPLVSMAGQGGRLSSRETHAEDLADVVSDNQRKQVQLDAYAKRLDELASRKDLAVADLITLSHEQAQVQQQRESLQGEAVMQQRRLDTNVLTLDFHDAEAGSRAHRLGESFRGLLDRLIDGLGDALSALAYGLPFLLLALPLAWAWRWAWRRITRRVIKAPA
ncbi:DUF4349 domain-containing protein [Dyella amyloliquefaciens]|uniref:DUF4349 domain-containing protein n=1 Tax=Dyella amyloliquefaciens TaxID=1770545 RepID=UPI00102E86DE|nr:DUF4349 domain-containing protein [Dyella amyloliquefaciens]